MDLSGHSHSLHGAANLEVSHLLRSITIWSNLPCYQQLQNRGLTRTLIIALSPNCSLVLKDLVLVAPSPLPRPSWQRSKRHTLEGLRLVKLTRASPSLLGAPGIVTRSKEEANRTFFPWTLDLTKMIAAPVEHLPLQFSLGLCDWGGHNLKQMTSDSQVERLLQKHSTRRLQSLRVALECYRFVKE